MTIDTVPVEVTGADVHRRGLHLVVIDPTNGRRTAAQAFDTYRSSASFHEFLDYYRIPYGHIVVAACKDDCVSKLSYRARRFFAEMGSVELPNLGYRTGWAFIGVFGMRTPLEKKAIPSEPVVTLTQVFQTANWVVGGPLPAYPSAQPSPGPFGGVKQRPPGPFPTDQLKPPPNHIAAPPMTQPPGLTHPSQQMAPPQTLPQQL